MLCVQLLLLRLFFFWEHELNTRKKHAFWQFLNTSPVGENFAFISARHTLRPSISIFLFNIWCETPYERLKPLRKTETPYERLKPPTKDWNPLRKTETPCERLKPHTKDWNPLRKTETAYERLKYMQERLTVNITSGGRYSTCCPARRSLCPWKQKQGKAIPLQAWTGPESSRRLRLPDFRAIATRKW